MTRGEALHENPLDDLEGTVRREVPAEAWDWRRGGRGSLEGCGPFRKAAKGRVRGEDVYAAYGRTEAGRHVIVFFVFKKPDSALPISARDMSRSERRHYDKKT